MRTVVFFFEHLPACSLGCYGEWTIATPEFDALASQSVLFENFLASPQGPGVLDLLAARHPGMTLIASPSAAGRAAGAVVPVATFPAGELPTLSQLAEWLSTTDGHLLCIQCAAPLPWVRELTAIAPRWPMFDAEEAAGGDPLTLGSPFSTENSPGAEGEPSSSEMPVDLSVRFDDASTAATYRTWPRWKRNLLAHAAQVQRCDELLSRWLELLEQILEPGDLLVLTAAGGDERRIPDQRSPWLRSLAEPVVHLPLIMHVVEGKRHRRIPALITTEEAVQFILNPDQIDARIPEDPATVIHLESSAGRGRRSRNWLILERRSDGDSEAALQPTEPQVQLFAKPEDLWEMHDLSRQYPELIDEYRTCADSPGIL